MFRFGLTWLVKIKQFSMLISVNISLRRALSETGCISLYNFLRVGKTTPKNLPTTPKRGCDTAQS
jgi:hypothetical protein